MLLLLFLPQHYNLTWSSLLLYSAANVETLYLLLIEDEKSTLGNQDFYKLSTFHQYTY